MTETELMNLHEGNMARYRICPTQFTSGIRIGSDPGEKGEFTKQDLTRSPWNIGVIRSDFLAALIQTSLLKGCLDFQ